MIIKSISSTPSIEQFLSFFLNFKFTDLEVQL